MQRINEKEVLINTKTIIHNYENDKEYIFDNIKTALRVFEKITGFSPDIYFYLNSEEYKEGKFYFKPSIWFIAPNKKLEIIS